MKSLEKISAEQDRMAYDRKVFLSVAYDLELLMRELEESIEI